MAAIILFGIILVNNNGFSSLVPAYSQGQNINSTSSPSSSFHSKASMIDNLPSQKVTVGNIDIAYKKVGKGSGAKPIILITGLGATMDMWNPLLLEQLSSSNHTVIIFDNRGAGESTAGGTKEFSISQFANDTVGLLEALKIDKADVLGWSMGSFIAQELALTNPDKVGSLILYASGCGGKEAKPPSPEVIKTLSNTSMPPQELRQKLISLLFPTVWFKANPDFLNYFPIPKESVSPEIMGKQSEAIAKWSGTCNTIPKITQPTLIIVGTEDIVTPAANSLILVERIPSSWLVQIRDAGHGLMYQYPDEFNRVLMTFLEYNS
ncbi:MAG TPA: alpha/beta hydrolase [Nitrososphaeraceae archaeon]|nr:alpha/beta hydrolase [Nitrososphaeraceae archaeon]